MPLLVQLGSEADLGLGHPARCINVVLAEYAGDGSTRHTELPRYGSDVPDGQVSGGQAFGFFPAELAGSP